MSIQSYSQIYDFKKKKYLSLEKKEGKNLFNKYVEIYNCLNEQGKKKISQLYNLPDLSIHYIDVISDSISKSHSESTLNKNNILMRIPFNKAPGDIIYHVVSPSEYNSQDNILPEGNSLLSNIEISFQRPDGTIYDLKGLDFTIKLEISTCDPTIVETFTNLN